mmetsp:Transcript_24301/g.21569  ORF Transcript_24301/g.21569 Transcript_24301/m.21569 type:complete len:98 (+) Transcript_24301:375-668(+)
MNGRDLNKSNKLEKDASTRISLPWLARPIESQPELNTHTRGNSRSKSKAKKRKKMKNRKKKNVRISNRLSTPIRMKPQTGKTMTFGLNEFKGIQVKK